MKIITMNKKGYLFGALTDTIIFVILFIAFIIFATNLYANTRGDTPKSLKILNDAIKEVAKLPPGSSKLLKLSLDKDSAIIGFNPNKDFLYVAVPKIESELKQFGGGNILGLHQDKKFFYLKGFFMKRPTTGGCKNPDDTCFCYCEGYNYETNPLSQYYQSEDAHIICEDGLVCIASEDVYIKDKIEMDTVFDDLNRGFKYGPLTLERDQHYWDGSFIILRSSLINTREFALLKSYEGSYTTSEGDVELNPEFYEYPWVISGYRDFYPLSVVDVTIVSQSDGTISICFKNDCSIGTVPICRHTGCRDIGNNEELCNDPTKPPGCENFKENCRWDQRIKLCTQI